MNLSQQIATQFREVILNGTWISTNLKAEISDLNWEQATTKVADLNTIALLTFHLDYYVGGLIQVLEGGTLDIRDKYSFDMESIESEEDWENLRQRAFSNADRLADLIGQLSEEKMAGGFVEEKYGTYYRNLIGMIEHSYYHLGQVVLLKKLILQGYGN